MDVQKLQSLLNKEEGPKLDFKLEMYMDTGSGKKELVKDVSAIANSRGGRGYIIFGVEDKTKEIVGINPEDFVEEKIQQVISTRCEPPIPVSLEVLEFKNKHIAVLTIYSGEQKPYQIRESGSFYIRRGSTTDIMRKEELASLLQESGLLSLELTPVLRADVHSLDIKKVLEYSVKIGIPFDGSNFNILDNIGIVTKDREDDRYHPTTGGLLLFGLNPQIYLPHCSIRIFNKVNSKLEQVRTLTGPILKMMDDAQDFIIKVVQKSSYPVGAIDEALANAVAYRDYFDIYNDISVSIAHKSIEVVSPGSMVRGGGGESGMDTPIRRNIWLYQRLITLDAKDRFLETGRGFKRMRNAFKGHGRVKLINMEDKNIFKVIFPGTDAFK